MEKTFLEKQYENNTDIIKFEVKTKDFKEIYDFLKVFERKVKKLDIFGIEVKVEISYKDKSCRF